MGWNLVPACFAAHNWNNLNKYIIIYTDEEEVFKLN